MQGHCLCGAVTITVDGAHDPHIGACHCRMCQRWSGGLFVCFSAAAAAVTVSGAVGHHTSSEFAERAFCPVCGSHLWMRNTGAADEPYELMPGLFDAAHEFPLRSEIYIDRAFNALRLKGDHKTATRDEYEATNLFIEGDNP